jgi:hypothetical protein
LHTDRLVGGWSEAHLVAHHSKPMNTVLLPSQ